MSCEECRERQKEAAPVPFVVHEADMARHERQHKRAFIIILVLIVLLVATNAIWIWYESLG